MKTRTVYIALTIEVEEMKATSLAWRNWTPEVPLQVPMTTVKEMTTSEQTAVKIIGGCHKLAVAHIILMCWRAMTVRCMKNSITPAYHEARQLCAGSGRWVRGKVWHSPAAMAGHCMRLQRKRIFYWVNHHRLNQPALGMNQFGVNILNTWCFSFNAQETAVKSCQICSGSATIFLLTESWQILFLLIRLIMARIACNVTYCKRLH